MIKFFKNLFNLNKIVKQQEILIKELSELKLLVQKQETSLNKIKLSIEKNLVNITKLENKFNEITTK